MRVEKQLLSVREFADAIGVGESLAKKLVREQRIVSVTIGDRRLIPASAVRAYVDGLVAEATSDRELATA
jgi:excisionase family DNA binding protein